MSADQTVEIPNQPGLNIDLTRMREAALHAQVHGAVFKASGSQVRQVLDYLHDRTLEIKRLNARIADLEAKLTQQLQHLTNEKIQQIDDETPFHESPDWTIRFAKNLLKAAAKQRESTT